MGVAGRECRFVKLRRGMTTGEMDIFYRGEVPKKSKQRDNILKSSVNFHKLLPQSTTVRRGRSVESGYHRVV